MDKRIILFLLLIVTFTGTFSYVRAQEKIPHVESSVEPIVERKEPLQYDKPLVEPEKGVGLSSPVYRTMQSSAVVVSPNLIPNPSVEIASTSKVTVPSQWAKGGYGNNTRTLTYPVTGYNSTKAIKVEISNHVTGDVKWFFDEVPVQSGKEYTFSNKYISNIPSIIDVRFKLSDGSYVYKDVAFIAPSPSSTSSSTSSTFGIASANFIAPDRAVSATIFHLIKQNGYLITDDFSLQVVSAPPQPIDPMNLVSNPGFEQVGVNGLPLNWKKGGWGTLSSTSTYPTVGGDGSKAARVDIASYTSGDVKWYFTPISLASGVYTYSEEFSSNIESTITIQLQDSFGAYSYKNLARLPASQTFKATTVDFTVPSGTKNITVFHLIAGTGFLSIDNVEVRRKSDEKGVFLTGAVTFRFDDGWLSQYTNVLPVLNTAGFKGTFFIATKQLADDGYLSYITKDQIQQIYSYGHEVSAHTRTHIRLSALTPAEQTVEIGGSRQDMLAMNVGSVTTFAYPFGDYNEVTLDLVKSAGFTAAVSTINDFVSPTSDPYQLEARTFSTSTTVNQVKDWIDEAVTNKKWLILTFHEVNISDNPYSIIPNNFNQIVDYVSSKKIPVVTIQEGVQSVQ